MKRIKTNNTSKNKSRRNVIIAICVIVLLITFIVSRWFFQLMLIQGNSMLPNYHSMQMVWINKQSKDISRGDVAAIKVSGIKGLIVKRVAAVPNDTVEIKNNRLYVNGKASDIYGDAFFEYAGELEKKLTLASDEFIVLGDNHAESKDSRYSEIGIVTYRQIVGKIYPNRSYASK